MKVASGGIDIIIYSTVYGAEQLAFRAWTHILFFQKSGLNIKIMYYCSLITEWLYV